MSTFVEHIHYANTGDMFACLMNQDAKGFNKLIVVSIVAAAAQVRPPPRRPLPLRLSPLPRCPAPARCPRRAAALAS